MGGMSFSNSNRGKNQNKNRGKRQAGMRPMDGKMDEEPDMAMMGSKMLQGFLMMSQRDKSRMPKVLRELPECLTQLLWSPDEEPQGTLCAKLPVKLRGKVREVMMMVLKKDLPQRLMKMDW